MNDQFESVYQEYKNYVFRLALSYTKNIKDSEDILQNVFLKYYRNNSKIPKEKTKSWLTKVTINDCKTYWLYFWKRGTVELDENQLSDGNESSNFLESISCLKPKDSLIIHLYYYEGYKIKEISKILKMKESTVKSRLKRAKEKIKDLLEE